MSQGNLPASLSTVLQRLSERLRAHRAPAGYRPGVTLEHVRRNLGLAHFVWSGPTTATVASDDGRLQLEIVERTESQWLMHLVMTEFVLRVPASMEGTARLELHHGGAVRRKGLRCRQRGADQALAARLQAAVTHDQGLYQALMPLDFKRLRIDLHERQWCVRLEHMGGSEVVNRMPAFRRYIALGGEQRAALLASLSGLQRVLASF